MTALIAGQKFPQISTPKLGGGQLDLTKPADGYDWKAVIVYRGKHCPICTGYLSKLNELLPKFHELGIDVVAVSGDPKEKAEAQIGEVNPNYEVGYDLSIEQMRELGLYISNPRSAAETDIPFSEPGFFVIDSEGDAQIIDISNAPFSRPELDTMLMGLAFIRNPENNYPVRGTHN